MNAKGRNYNIDLLRIFSAMAVVVIHVSAKNFDTAHVPSAQFIAFDIYDSLARWAVPVFVMISGRFMLEENKELCIKKLYSKNILRVLTAFVFWSAAYTVYNRIFEKKGIVDTVKEFIFGQYFMWFLFMIIALYAFTPILRKISADRATSRYLLIVFFVLMVALPTLIIFTNGGYYEEVTRIFDEHTHLHLILGINGLLYLGYYLLGHYISNTKISRKGKAVIYMLGIISVIATVALTYFYSMKSGKPDYRFYNYLTLNVLFESAAVFVFFNGLKISCGEKTKPLIVKLSKYSFGVYLIHPMIIDILNRYGFNSNSFNAFIAVPVITAATYFTALAISAAINQIPLLKKYIV